MAQCSNVRVLEQEGQLQNRIFHSSHRSSNIGAKPICTAERKGRPNEIIALTLASWIAKLSLAFPILWKRERGVGLSREKKGIWLGKGGGGVTELHCTLYCSLQTCRQHMHHIERVPGLSAEMVANKYMQESVVGMWEIATSFLLHKYSIGKMGQSLGRKLLSLLPPCRSNRQHPSKR